MHEGALCCKASATPFEVVAVAVVIVVIVQWTSMRRSSVVIVAFVVAGGASVAWAFFDGSLFAWHPASMATGFATCMTLGVAQAMSARGEVGEERTGKLRRHMYLQLSAALTIFLGFIAITSNKVVRSLRRLSPLENGDL